jgi:hypothetical protein
VCANVAERSSSARDAAADRAPTSTCLSSPLCPLYNSPHCAMTTGSLGLLFGPVATFSMRLTVSIPSITFPNTTCLLSSHSAFAHVMKNWHPFVLGPEFACVERRGWREGEQAREEGSERQQEAADRGAADRGVSVVDRLHADAPLSFDRRLFPTAHVASHLTIDSKPGSLCSSWKFSSLYGTPW